MDYLDPQKKKQKRTYLMLMYVLLAIAISIATYVFAYMVQGYSIDRQTGEVIQNGLLYVDSKPESAKIYLNGQKQRGKTDARLVVPEGGYSIELKREGYRPWQRSLTLDGGSLRLLTYARLVPESLDTDTLVALPAEPTVVTQSPDKRWVVMMSADSPLKLRVLDTERLQAGLSETILPIDIIDTKQAGSWKFIEWSDDNKTILASFTTALKTEFFVLNREDGTKAVNLTKLFASQPFTLATLRARKNDEYYLFNAGNKAVYEANLTTPTDARVVVSDVVDFKVFGDAVLYVTTANAPEGKVTVNLKDGETTYKLRDIAAADRYFLDVSKLGSAFVVGVGSTTENRVIVYRDPIAAIKQQNGTSTIPVPTTVLNVPSPQQISISADSSIIMAWGAQNIATHEFEVDRSYSFKLPNTVDTGSTLRWADGQHLLVSMGGKQWLMDFDGSNQYELLAANPLLGSYLDKNNDHLFNFSQTQAPDQPITWQIMRSYLRSAKDRQ